MIVAENNRQDRTRKSRDSPILFPRDFRVVRTIRETPSCVLASKTLLEDSINASFRDVASC